MAAGRIHNFAFFLLTFYFPNWINQFESIMQNKPNLLNTQMNVNTVITKDYENEHLRWAGKTKPIQTQYKANTNPIQSQYKPNPRKAKMNVTSILTKDYENKRLRWAGKTKPIQTQSNPKIPTSFLSRLRLQIANTSYFFVSSLERAGNNVFFQYSRYSTGGALAGSRLFFCSGS